MFKSTYIRELEDELRNSKTEIQHLMEASEMLNKQYWDVSNELADARLRIINLANKAEEPTVLDGKVLLARSQNSREEFVQYVWDESMEVITGGISHQVQRGLEYSWETVRLIGQDYSILKEYSEQQFKEFKDDIKQKMNDTFKNMNATVTIKHEIQPIYMAGMHKIKSFDLSYELVWGEEEQHNA